MTPRLLAPHGVVVRSRAGRLRHRLVQDWWAAAQRPGEQHPIMIALRRRDVADLNDRARALLAEHGRLGPDPITIARREFAVGDRIITLRNARRLGVLNGTLATVTGLDHDRGALLVRTDEGRELVLPRWYLDRPGPFHHRRRLDHAYAITCHKAQGMTTDRAFVLATDELYKQWGYVAMSRGRLENKLYTTVDDHPLAEELDVPREPKPDAVLAVTAALELSRAQYLALDQLTATGGSSSTPPSNCEIHHDVGPSTAPPPPATSPAADPQEDLARLRVLHRACSTELLHAREQLATQRPGWRRRRLLSKTIASRQRTLDELDRQIARLEARPPEIATSQGGPATSQGTHAGAKTAPIEHDPPRYLIAELGGWPHTHAAQTVWRIAARRIRAYRSSAGVTDPKTPLGPPPDDPNQHAQRQAVAELIRSAGKAIDALDSPARPDPTNPAALELP